MIINLPHQGRHFVSRVSRRCFLKFQNQSENQLTPETRCSARFDPCSCVCVRATFVCVLSLSVFVSGVSVSVCVGEHVSVCLCVYVLLFAKKLTFKTQKSAQVACICVLFSRLACLCLFVFVSLQTRHDRFCVFSIFVLFLICPSMLQSV